MILFAKQKVVRKQKKLAMPDLEAICADGNAVVGLNTWNNKEGIFCTKRQGICPYQSTKDNRIVAYGVKINGETYHLPLCMLAPDYEQSAKEVSK